MINRYWLTQVPDHVLVRDLTASVAQDRSTTALMLAQLAEADDRRLYAAAGYPSMFEYCVRELRMSEDAAYKRIRAARVARQFPAIFDAVADGRLHLSAVVLLAPHLAPETADELLAAGEHRTKAEIEQLLAARFPKPDLVTRVRAIPSVPRSERGAATTLVAGLEAAVDQHATPTSCQLAPGPVGMTIRGQIVPPTTQPAPGQVEPPAPRPTLTPLAPQRYALQLTLDQETHDLVREAQALLGHAVPGADVGTVIHRALLEMVRRLRQRRSGATANPRPRKSHANGRYVPAEIRREVWQRDGGRCTFVGERGHRCEECTRLEFDHVTPVARGGATTAANLRLRCRAHNLFEAERSFGAGFMDGTRCVLRTDAKPAADLTRSRNASLERERAAAAAAGERNADVIPWLRRLGFRADEAGRAAARCDALTGASLEARVRHALKTLAPVGTHRGSAAATCPG